MLHTHFLLSDDPSQQTENMADLKKPPKPPFVAHCVWWPAYQLRHRAKLSLEFHTKVRGSLRLRLEDGGNDEILRSKVQGER